MEERFRDILNDHPPRRSRSRLEPYADLIVELRTRGRSFREIAELLGEKFDVAVTAAGVHDFVRRSKAKAQKRSVSPQPSYSLPKATTPQSPFTFDEAEPLKLSD